MQRLNDDPMARSNPIIRINISRITQNSTRPYYIISQASMTSKVCPRAARLVKKSHPIAPVIHRTVHINAVAGPSRASSLRPLTPNSGSARQKPVRLARGQIRSYHYYTDVERGHERIIQTATSRVEEFDKASEAVRLHPYYTCSTFSSSDNLAI
jgi:hypothetical protein